MVANKPKRLLAILCSTIAISAHATIWNNIGDDGNPNTLGNAGVKAKNTQTLLRIKNHTGDKIARVIIINQNNNQLYGTTLECANDKFCNLRLGTISLPKEFVLKFYDEKNHMISAYNYSGELNTYDTIIIDDKWLGIYVFNKLKQQAKFTPTELNNELTYFFQNYSSPDGTPDIFEELGLYFIAQNGGANEGKFYQNLLKKLEQDKILGAKIISPAMTKNVFATSSSGIFVSDGLMCNSTAGKIATWAKSIFSFIPVLSGVGTVIGITSQISKAGCAKSDPNAAKFDQIDDNLRKLNAEVSALGYNLKDLAQKLHKELVFIYLKDMENDYNTLFNNYFLAYSGFNNGLSNFVNNTGGLKNSFKNNYNVKTLVGSMQAQLNAYNALVDKTNVAKLKENLNNWCSNQNNITGDVVAQRMQCNLITNQVATYYLAAAAQLKIMLNDEINTVVVAQKSGNIDANWLIGNISGIPNGFDSKGWANSMTYVNNQIETKLDSAITILLGKDGKAVYDPLAGFPTKLADSMKAANCLSKTENGSALPAVSGWILNNADMKAGPYIISTCQSENKVINARYYYKQRNTSAFDYDVVNVMGVLVPERFFQGGTGKNYGDGNAFPWNHYGWMMTIKSDSDDNQLKAIFNVPKDSTVVAYGFHPNEMTKKFLAPNKGYIEKFIRNGKSYTRKIFTPTTSKNGHPAFEVSYYMADWWQIGPGEFYSFIRNTDESGISSVWTIRSMMNIPTGSNDSRYISLLMTQQCMTNDCTVGYSKEYQRDLAPTFYALQEISFQADNRSTRISWYKPNSSINPELMMYVNGEPVYSK